MTDPAAPAPEAVTVAAAVAGTSTTLEVAAANPLRDPRDKRLPRVAGPCVMVLFGVTGDLAKRKLLPAIYDLGNRGCCLPGSRWSGSPGGIGRTRTSRSSPMTR